jgi:hypothetical protein
LDSLIGEDEADCLLARFESIAERILRRRAR